MNLDISMNCDQGPRSRLGGVLWGRHGTATSERGMSRDPALDDARVGGWWAPRTRTARQLVSLVHRSGSWDSGGPSGVRDGELASPIGIVGYSTPEDAGETPYSGCRSGLVRAPGIDARGVRAPPAALVGEGVEVRRAPGVGNSGTALTVGVPLWRRCPAPRSARRVAIPRHRPGPGVAGAPSRPRGRGH